MSDIQEKILELMDLFDDDEVTTADKINRPEPKQSVKEIELFNEFNIRNPKAGGGMLVQPSADGRRPGYAKMKLDKNTIKKIKNKITLKKGQKWNFYDPEKNPNGFTYGIPKEDPNYDIARNLKPGRLETKLKKATEKYKEIKANPKLLAQKKAYDRELYMGKRDEILEARRLEYETNKDFREKKLEWAKQDKIKNPEKYKQKLNDYFAKKGRFPPGNNYKENVWRDMFRSSQKSGQERFLLVDEKGNLLTEDKFPRIKNKVRWDVGGAYKKIKFYDTVTKQFVKFDNSIKGKGVIFEKYLDQKSVGGKNAFKNAINGYRNKDDIKNLTFKDSKGKTIRLGTIVQEKLNDGVNFINSGVNVQHSDLNNAFWKNEVTLASSNNELNYLEQTLERELRNAGSDVDKRNKIKNNFKFKINKLPGGITKIVEGETFGVKPTTQSVVEAVGKESKLTRFKDFSNIRNKILELASTVTDRCAIGNADGGRIGYSLGSEACFKIGKQIVEDILLKGGAKGKQLDLAKTILRAGSGLKNMLSLRGTLGPAALAFTVGTEAGLVGYDMLTKGETLREAFGNSLFNYALGKDYQIDPQEELFKRFKGLGYDDQQIGGIKRALDTLNTINTGKNLVTGLEQQFTDNVVSRGQPEEFMMDEDQFISDTAGQRAEQNLKDAKERLIAFNQSLKEVDRPGGMKKEDVLSEYFSSGKYAEDLNLFNQAEKEANLQKLTSAGPKFVGSVFPKFEQQRQIDINKNLGVLVNPAFDIPGMKESTGGFLYGFADGGLSGGDKSGPPPESGPTPHGLPGILKRVKNI